MEKVKVNYPISPGHNQVGDGNQYRFLAGSIMASIGGASIPAIIFYFLL